METDPGRLDQMRANGERMRQELAQNGRPAMGDRSAMLAAKQQQMQGGENRWTANNDLARMQANFRNQQAQQAGGYQGGMGLPEQLPPGPVDPNMQMKFDPSFNFRDASSYKPYAQGEMLSQSPGNPADEPTADQRANPEYQAREQALKQKFMQNRGDALGKQQAYNPDMQAERGMPHRQLPPQAMGQPQGQPFNQPSQPGTPAQMPMANTMNPNAPSARPSMGGRQNMMKNRMRGQMMGRQGRMQQAGQQQQSPTPGAELGGVPRSVTPF